MLSTAVFLCLAFASLCSANIVFVDSSTKSYLTASQSDATVKLETESLSSVVAALTGLFPPYVVDQADQDSIAQLVKPSPLAKPRAYVVINLAGLSDAVEVFGSRQHWAVEVEGDASAAQAHSLSAIFQANPDVNVRILDQQALKSCTNNCIEEHLPTAAETFGGKHAGSVLTFASGEHLDLAKLSDKLFAVELASLWGGLQHQLQQYAQQDKLQQDIQVYEITLLGLQGLSATYGAGSPQVLAAQDAVRSFLRKAVDALDSAFDGDVVFQLGCFDAVPAKDGLVESIMEWKQQARRHLAQAGDAGNTTAGVRATWPPSDEVQAAKQFSTKAAAYGGFIALLYFSLGAVWCMCNMPMAVDTLLFGSKKTD